MRETNRHKDKKEYLLENNKLLALCAEHLAYIVPVQFLQLSVRITIVPSIIVLVESVRCLGRTEEGSENRGSSLLGRGTDFW